MTQDELRLVQKRVVALSFLLTNIETVRQCPYMTLEAGTPVELVTELERTQVALYGHLEALMASAGLPIPGQADEVKPTPRPLHIDKYHGMN